MVQSVLFIEAWSIKHFHQEIEYVLTHGDE